MTQKLKYLMILITLLAGLAVVVHSPPAYADTKLTNADCPPITGPLPHRGLSTVGPKETVGKVCKRLPSDCPSGDVDKKDDSKCLPLGSNPVPIAQNPIVKDLNEIVNVLAALVGVVVVGSIILGGIQFATAGDKAEAVSAAKQRIINGLMALAAFLFIFAFLQWLIPGGIFFK